MFWSMLVFAFGAGLATFYVHEVRWQHFDEVKRLAYALGRDQGTMAYFEDGPRRVDSGVMVVFRPFAREYKRRVMLRLAAEYAYSAGMSAGWLEAATFDIQETAEEILREAS